MTTHNAIIYVVDDEPEVGRALCRLVQSEGYQCKRFESAEALLGHRGDSDICCAIVDLNLPGLNGLELQSRLEAAPEPYPIIFLSGNGDIETSVKAMKAGAVDFLTKPVDALTLLAAIKNAVDLACNRRAAHQAESAALMRLARLTPRENEVLQMVVKGLMNKQIASLLGVAEKTVKVHRARVMQKLEVRTLADLVRFTIGADR